MRAELNGRSYHKTRQGKWVTFAAAKWTEIKNQAVIKRLNKQRREMNARLQQCS